jgi:GT2 family glycosyltransferase
MHASRNARSEGGGVIATQGVIQVSFVIATRDRREPLLKTLTRLRNCGVDGHQAETFVIDNASADGTADAVARQFPEVRLVPLAWNRGACAKNVALPDARGHYVVFLDDDSFPMPASIARMIRHFEADPQLGAAGFTIWLPDGTQESSAYPGIFIGCGVGFRRRALDQVGGLPEDFFMQAEEYDLSLRLMQAGWSVRNFDDLHVLHLKSPVARQRGRTIRLDVRNNYVLASRYFPGEWRRALRSDWMRRYRLMAAASGRSLHYWAGRSEGMWRSVWGRRSTISVDVFERFARPNEILNRLRVAQQRHQIRRALFLDYGKNILPYWLAARELEIEVVAVADDRLANSGAKYHGVPVVTDAVGRSMEFDAAVVSNCSPVRAQERIAAWRMIERRPVVDPFDPAVATGEAATSADQAASQSRRTAARIA